MIIPDLLTVTCQVTYQRVSEFLIIALIICMSVYISSPNQNKNYRVLKFGTLCPLEHI